MTRVVLNFLQRSEQKEFLTTEKNTLFFFFVRVEKNIFKKEKVIEGFVLTFFKH